MFVCVPFVISTTLILYAKRGQNRVDELQKNQRILEKVLTSATFRARM